MSKLGAKSRSVAYSPAADGTCCIDNYDLATPFASFFPGIAGAYGIPLWAFFVNRGQAVVSFGTKNKDSAILEFFPANRAWQVVSSQGFRTFLKLSGGRKSRWYEPFQLSPEHDALRLRRSLTITDGGIRLQEVNTSLGMTVEVEYSTLAEEPVAALIRRVRIINTGRAPLTLEGLDGVPFIAPYGNNNWCMKFISRTLEAWMRVYYVSPEKVPFFKLAVDPADRPEVIPVQGGNFYYGYSSQDGTRTKLRYIVDAQTVFGPVLDFQYPQLFWNDGFEFPAHQAVSNRTPAAFGLFSGTLAPGAAMQVYSVIGHAAQESAVARLVRLCRSADFLDRKIQRQEEIVRRLKRTVLTVSNEPVYDSYCQQTYLDNVLRGGYPMTLPAKDKNMIFHVYSRKHGDLERDYNNFLLEPTYFSQGNGNYRDVNQNRRMDIWFNPQVQQENIVRFLNLLQLDGFNPLVVVSARFAITDERIFARLTEWITPEPAVAAVRESLRQPFTPGGLFLLLEQQGATLSIPREQLLAEVLAGSEKRDLAEHGEGFWVDHWTYNLDSLESFQAIFPERYQAMFFEWNELVYFQNCAYVKDREDKYVLYGNVVRQYHSVAEDHSRNKQMAERYACGDWMVRTGNGTADVYRTTVAGKLFCLLVNKMASFDPFGCGMEMEADKPGWYDALNGLPGLFGSSVCETLELKRLVRLFETALQGALPSTEYSLSLPGELAEFAGAVVALAGEYLTADPAQRDFMYWQRSGELKESYRRSVRLGLRGDEVVWAKPQLFEALRLFSEKLTIAIEKSRDAQSGLVHTYFLHEVTRYETIQAQGAPKRTADGLVCVRPLAFRQVPLPAFLEGQVHALRLESGLINPMQLYKNVRASSLYDRKLGMFKVNADLSAMTDEIGRCRVFTPGWLENESIWLHMEYKFILELLRNGLYKEFFKEFRAVLIPFLDPARYGRSTLENSSFIVSSAYPDKSLHGAGFVARLSGSTAEFIQMWLWMNIGRRPFQTDERGALTMVFAPTLPAWLFTRAARTLDTGEQIAAQSYAFRFMEQTLIVYHNPRGKDTYGAGAAHPRTIRVEWTGGSVAEFSGNSLPAEAAGRVRDGQAARISVALL